MATAEDNAQIIQQAAYELQMFGKISAETANKLADAKTGITNFNDKVKQAGLAANSLADAFVSYNKQIYSGSSANKAAAESMDKMAEAAKYAGAFLALLVPGGPIVKAFVAGIGLLASKSLQASKLIAEQADQVYKGFQGLAQAGAVGKGGMQDVFKGLMKVGLGTEKFGEYLKLVNENAQDLALFSGTVLQGRKTFEDTMGSLSDGQRVQMEQMGLDRTLQTEAVMAYIKQQRILTMGTKAQMDTSSASVMRYIKETDELTRITGLSRKEQEKAVESAMHRETFAAKIDQLVAEGRIDEAENLKKGLILAKASGKTVEDAFVAAAGGFLTSEAATKGYTATNGALFEFLNTLDRGKMSNEQIIESYKKVSSGAKDVYEGFGRSQAMMGNMENVGFAIGDTRRLIQQNNNDMTKALKEGQAELKGVLDDPLTKQAAKNENTVRNTQIAQMELVNQGLAAFVTANGSVASANNSLMTTIGKLADAMEKRLMPAVENLAALLNKILKTFFGPNTEGYKKAEATYDAASDKRSKAFENATFSQKYLGVGRTSEQDQANQEQQKAQRELYLQHVEASSGKDQADRLRKQYEQLEKRATGGPVGKGTPYLVGEEGPELFVPSIAGDIVPLNKLTGTTGAALRQSERIEKAVKEITLDTIEIEKITDTDAKRAKDYSKFYQTYIELRTTYEKKQMELINYQMNESSGGGGGSAGGSGLQLPAARSIAGMGGGQGLTKMGQGDLAQMGLMIRSKDTQAEGAGISPSLIELAKQIQSGVPGFAGFTAFNDKFHNEKAPSSQHTKGLALDFALGEKPSIETGRAITQWLRDSGASLAIDEYNNPSAGATGGHIHAQIPAFAEGGQLGAGRVGIAGEAGPELITGPASITPMNDLTRALDSMSGLLQQSVMKLDEISRATQRNGDINDKMLSYAQN